MRSVSESGNMEIFSLPTVKAIILFQWKFFRIAIFSWVFIPFLVYFALIIVYTTITFERKVNGVDQGEHFITCWLIIAVIAYFVCFEVIQISLQKMDYFTSFWNYVDVISLVLNAVIVFADLAGLEAYRLRALFSFAVLIMWFKLFYLLRFFFRTAFLVRMIIEIVRDMKWFVFVFSLAVGGFAHSFWLISENPAPDGEPFINDHFLYAFAFSYRMSLGEFDVDGFEGTKYKLIAYVMWVLGTVTMLIILLNMLIAIMADTFERVQESSESQMLQEVASMMRENHFLLNRKKTFGKYRYIYVISTERGEEENLSWEGRLQYLKKFIGDVGKDVVKHLDASEKRVTRMVDKRLNEVETRVNRHHYEMSSKLQEIAQLLGRRQDSTGIVAPPRLSIGLDKVLIEEKEEEEAEEFKNEEKDDLINQESV